MLALITFSLTIWSLAARHADEQGKQPVTDRLSNWKSLASGLKPIGLIDAAGKGKKNSTSILDASIDLVHKGITTTVFWVGEPADKNNDFISNTASAWDDKWQVHYGGFDDPDKRQGYYPSGFVPKENPFYIALPYNDLDESGKRKIAAGICPNSQNEDVAQYSWCKNAWIAVTHDGKTAYAQWEDVGPLEEDDSTYVFGQSSPKNTWGMKAGLDVSPAVRDYLGLQDVDKTDWKFVSAKDVPSGPWKKIITTNKGYLANS